MEKEESIDLEDRKGPFVAVSIWAKFTIWEQSKAWLTLPELTAIQELIKQGDNYEDIENLILTTEDYECNINYDTQTYLNLADNDNEPTIELYFEENFEINGEIIGTGNPYLTNRQEKEE